MNITETLRHFLAALAYRFHTVVDDAPAEFGVFDPGSGVRPPAEIVRHMIQVLKFAHWRFEAKSSEFKSSEFKTDSEAPPELDFHQEVLRFHDQLAILDQDLRGSSMPPEDDLLRLLQGPLADAMTHVGQIAMLRRMAGSPVPGKNFYKASVQRGRVGADQD